MAGNSFFKSAKMLKKEKKLNEKNVTKQSFVIFVVAHMWKDGLLTRGGFVEHPSRA